MGKIFQLGGPCSLCPLLATWLTIRQYFSCEDCAISLVTEYFHFIWWHHASTSYYVSHRHKKNNCDPAEDCYQSFWTIVNIFRGRERVGKIVQLGPLPPMPASGFVVGSTTIKQRYEAYGRIRPAKAFKVGPGGILNELKPRRQFFACTSWY